MSQAATSTGTRRRRRMELDALDRIARKHPAYNRVPPSVRARRLERLRRDIAAGRVQLP